MSEIVSDVIVLMEPISKIYMLVTDIFSIFIQPTYPKIIRDVDSNENNTTTTTLNVLYSMFVNHHNLCSFEI